MKSLRYLLAALAALLVLPSVQAQPASPEAEKAYQEAMKQIADRLHPQTGDVRLPSANAVLHLGEDYYFLPADEARTVLTEAWGNPADAATGVLGLVFPAGKSFADDTWGAVITYEATGYVSDEDAEATDYGELLTQLQSGEAELNARRAEQGFPAQHLVGWAQQPAYDRATHSVVWAQNIQFQGTPENALNYDIRLLGRNGVLSLNMVTGMSKLEETREAARRFAAAAEFTPGARYADFQQGDRVADYGVAGLVAAGVGATVAKKVGLLAAILAFGKKFIILIIAGFVALGAWINRRFLGGGPAPEDDSAYDYTEPMAEEPLLAAAESETAPEAGEPRPGTA
jgi:uncharacterized membrane-anchored protein